MPFIENCAAADISTGQFYTNPGHNSMLIQISDPAGWVPEPKSYFSEIYKFEFLDIEADDYTMDESWKFSDQQAEKIAQLLRRALDNDMNLIVHCFAGVSRSGAVCQAGVELGFRDIGSYRHPNQLVLGKLRQQLNLT